MPKPDVLFECRVINNREDVVHVLERGGRPMISVPPHDKEFLYCADAMQNVYSRFVEVRYNADGSVTAKKNPNWPRPEAWKDVWTIFCLNEGGHMMESVRLVADEPAIELFKGLEMEFLVPMISSYIWYERIWIHEDVVKEQDPERAKYVISRKKTFFDTVLRPAKDLQKIYDQLLQKEGADQMKLTPLPKRVRQALGIVEKRESQ
jgi:hypothetical protein